jgi:hypothetical protein
MKNEQNAGPKDGALGAAPKATWLETARKMPTTRTPQTVRTQTFEQLPPHQACYDPLIVLPDLGVGGS